MPDDGICCDGLRSVLRQGNKPLAKVFKCEVTSPTTWLMVLEGIEMRMPNAESVRINFCPFCGHKMRG